ncbi:MAG: diaminopimelate decarboxylase [Lewinellaceae bacterium]|nr:diaminopimelate decarboxylase [Saprospiraceae bacterium]MCB9329682.1 diaminopimelate decarboxylase [Lewinellaceae bacterium]
MELVNGKYQFSGGIDPLVLCKEFGTPLYVYDAAVMERQYRRIVNAFPYPKVHIHYACKALSNINVMRLFRQWGARLDCVSIQEVQMGLHAGYKPEDILYTPNFAAMDEYEMAAQLGAKINIDAIPMLENWGLHHRNIPVCIRINPHLMAGGHEHISVGHIDSKFGISIHQLPHVLRVVESQGLRIEGLHMHTGSDILDVDVFLRGAEILFEAARKFPDLQYIDLGSGFKVPYKPDDIETDVEELGEKLSTRFAEFCKEYGRPLTLMFEPGKFLVSEAGYLFAKCTLVKQTTSTVFIGLDTGLNHLIRPMFYGAYHKIVNVTEPTFKPRIYTVVGNICETDTFGIDRRIAEAVEGDILCFYNAGAYGWMMASNYNSRPRPAEVLLYQGKAHLIRRRETMDDLLANQIQLEL